MISTPLLSLAQNVYTYTVNPSVKHQEIDNFGASDCWTMYRFGKYATDESINEVADLLFSKEFDQAGQPKGIGLSMWRMNFGAGSHDNAYQAYRDIRGRMPCILKKSGYYDMALDGSCGGQFNFLKKAKERGCEYTLGFSNSPPYFMTRSGYTTGNEDSNKPFEAQYSLSLNLTEEKIEDFTDYLAEVVERTEKIHGIAFDYVDPVNEPEWGAWMGENMHATNFDIKKIVMSLNQKLVNKGLKTKIAIPESARLDFLYSTPFTSPPLSSSNYGKKIKNFLSPSGDCYVGDLSNVSHHIAGHGYFTTNPHTQLLQVRNNIPAELSQYNAKYWMTEYSIGDSYDEYMDNNQVDLSINYGLFIARIIHADLVVANASAWHWWLGLTDVNYKDGLIHLERNDDYNVAYQMTSDRNGVAPESAYREVYENSEIVQTKLLWCMGNYSRFIRPEARRIAVTSSSGVSNVKGLMVSAFENADGKKVIVVLNYSEAEQSVIFNIKDSEAFDFKPYITSDATQDNLRPMGMCRSTDKITIPKRSIITFVQEPFVGVEMPSKGEFEIKVCNDGFWVNSENCANIEVWNIAGQLEQSKSISENSNYFKLPKGVYIVRCISGNGYVTNNKIII